MTDIGDLFDLDVKDEFNKKSKVSISALSSALSNSSTAKPCGVGSDSRAACVR